MTAGRGLLLLFALGVLLAVFRMVTRAHAGLAANAYVLLIVCAVLGACALAFVVRRSPL